MRFQEPIIVLPEGFEIENTDRLKESCQEYINALVSWIREYHWILDSHAVDFFLKDYWNNTFPKEWRFMKEETHCSMTDLLHLATNGTCKPEWPESLRYFVEKCKTLPLPRDPSSCPQIHKFIQEEPPLNAKLTFGMNKKKIHEVRILSSLIHSIAKTYGINHILDMGSGQGYLDACLVFEHGYTVIGVDDNETQTCGAKWNADKIQKQLKSSKSSSLPKGALMHVNRRVHPSETFADVLKSLQENSSEDKSCSIHDDQDPLWLLCGLHTCGDLAPSMLRQFVQGQSKILVGVGCCYQHVTEKPNANTKHKHILSSEGPFGYPLSRAVKEHDLDLGFSCRMIACQAVCRWLEDPEASASNFTKHFYRALLQQVLFEQGLLPKELFFADEDITVGRLSRRKAFGHGFVHYAKIAFQKMNLDFGSREKDIRILEDYEREYTRREKEISVVWTFRSLMAEVLESLILMDRFMYLLEQNVHLDENAAFHIIPALIPLFDHRESPRNMVVVGVKVSTQDLME